MKKGIRELIALISKDPDCTVFEPNHSFKIEKDIPKDLAVFFELTNGVELFYEKSFGIKIIGKENFIPTNKHLYSEDDPIWQELENDRTNEWFLIAESPQLSQYISIDLNTTTLGKCYDSFIDIHGAEGMSDIVALNFTDLLWNFYNSKGQGDSWYWIQDSFEKLGDAFD